MKLSLHAKKIFMYYDKISVLNNISFKLKKNEALLIHGKNGSGKTTLLKILAGLQSPSGGKVLISDNNIKINNNFNNKYISYVADQLFFYNELTAFENIKFVLNNNEAKIKKALNWINLFKLTPFLNKNLITFSSGMYQKLRICTILALDTPIILLDEPEFFLDKEGQKNLKQLLKSMTGKIIIIASNNKTLYKFCREEISLD